MEFLLEQWQRPDGSYLSAEVPSAVRGHFGPSLASFVLYPYHHNHVTQPLLHQPLPDLGVAISAGQLNALVTGRHERFHDERADLKAAGLGVWSYVQSDDTGARPGGRNGDCTYVGNDRFAGFESTFSKSRVNFLGRWQTQRLYRLDENAVEYLARHGLAISNLDLLTARIGSQGVEFNDEPAWQRFLTERCALLGARARSDLHDYVKKRKISGSTRSDLGRQCRDTVASLKKTCRKHGLSFWDYLLDCVSGTRTIPYLPDVIRQAAQA